ncbi:hypothetical protein F7725_025018 [Dissostichus mawsoni]|uniref:Uncharacterized protein n=1 Tax=Dissostichus mawsoni TaxID=36200 RepID=A0A7J5X9Y0_DISMA|nr:hypothetical protein F7725_025018 [Dissostichus mawsoni]
MNTLYLALVDLCELLSRVLVQGPVLLHSPVQSTQLDQLCHHSYGWDPLDHQSYGEAVSWMDSTEEETALRTSMIDNPNHWVDATLSIRTNLAPRS